MSGLLKGRINMQRIRKALFSEQMADTQGIRIRFAGRFNKILENLGLKRLTAISLTTIIAAYKHSKDVLKDYEEGGGNVVTEKILHYKKERERSKIIGTGVGTGLAWFYYANYLKYILKDGPVDIELEMKKNDSLKAIKSNQVSTKLYILIPRKCYVNITEADDNIHNEGYITIGKKKVQLYSIVDPADKKMKYYCMCDCPEVLKTINHVNDIQMAGISRSKSSRFELPWNRNSIVQLFNENTKLVQLMRFYYALSSFLSIQIKDHKDARDTTRLILFNEAEQKLSEILLQAIQEDLNQSTKQKVSHRSLMEKTLLSPEEKKDVSYAYDVFVTYRRDLKEDEKKNCPIYNSDLTSVNHDFAKRKMKVLLEKDCLGKNWLTKLKFAATKCRWIVFLDTQDLNSKLFTSHKLNDSLQSILQSKKVQTAAMVNVRNNRLILDDLNLITCIPYNIEKLDTLYNVLSGKDINLLKSMSWKDLYRQPGDVAVGLAWDYAANHLSRFLPVISDTTDRTAGKKLKLFIAVPESCEHIKYNCCVDLSNTNNVQKRPLPFEPTKCSFFEDGLTPGSTEQSKEVQHIMTLVGEYALQVDMIRQMKENDLLTVHQMEQEVQIFCQTVDKIMEILLPEKTNDYEFVYFKDKKDNEDEKDKKNTEHTGDKKDKEDKEDNKDEVQKETKKDVEDKKKTEHQEDEEGTTFIDVTVKKYYESECVSKFEQVFLRLPYF